MAGRIRSIKPESLKDAELWDAEEQTHLPLFRAFAGLWCYADREGRFEWKPRELKTDVLPYWNGDFATVLDELAKRSFVYRYEVDGRVYGEIRTFRKHQFPNARETPSKIPPRPVTHVRARAQSDSVDREHVQDADAPSLPPPNPIPDPIPDPASSHEVSDPQEPDDADDRETICPLDLATRAIALKIPEQFAEKYHVSLAWVLYQVRETEGYWTIGGGTGSRRKNWMRVLRTRLHEIGKANRFVEPPGSWVDAEESNRRREADEAAEIERTRRAAEAKAGAVTNEQAKAAVKAAARSMFQ